MSIAGVHRDEPIGSFGADRGPDQSISLRPCRDALAQLPAPYHPTFVGIDSRQPASGARDQRVAGELQLAPDGLAVVTGEVQPQLGRRGFAVTAAEVQPTL